jgi:hypothetical protein
VEKHELPNRVRLEKSYRLCEGEPGTFLEKRCPKNFLDLVKDAVETKNVSTPLWIFAGFVVLSTNSANMGCILIVEK